MGQILEKGHMFDTMDLVEKRLSLLVGARFVDRSKISKAAAKMNCIRKKMTRKAKGFNATAEIRKWRDRLCKF